MIYHVMAVRDVAISAFMQPFFVAHVGMAKRSFEDAVRGVSEQKTDIARHPDDFDLYLLGTYDDAFATFDMLEHPDRVVRGKDCLTVSSPLAG